MARFAARRLLVVAPVALLVTLITFTLTYLTPGDPAALLLGSDATPEALQALRHQMGLDRTFLEQYVTWLAGILRGDLGVSYLSQFPVMELVGQALPVTLQLTVGALLVALGISIPAALIAARWRGGKVDTFVTLIAFAGLSMPTFWLGIMLLLVFAVHLGVLPAARFVDFGEDPVANIRSLILPSVTLGFPISTQLTRYLRASLFSAMESAYVGSARMKGLSEGRVITRHVLRNALIPFTTVVGIQVGYLLSGAVVVEELFAIPGMGRLALASIFNRDYQVIQGVVLVAALLFVLINLVVDLLYGLLDPRIRLARTGASSA